MPAGLIVVFGLLTALVALAAWRIHDEMQWETVMRTNVELRVASSSSRSYRFTPTLVDDLTGMRFSEKLGDRRCSGGPAALPAGTIVLAGIDTQMDRRDGRIRAVLDVRDLSRRYC